MNDRLLNEKVNGATTVSYSYDNNGSTLTKTENGVTTTYTWNDEKRMVSVTVGNTQQVEYTYNDQGIRVSSKVNGVETRYLLDEGNTANVWEEYSPNGSVQASYVYGRDLITQTQGTQTSYYLVDGLGSTRLLTDTQGQVLNSYGYEAFGEKINQSGSTDNKYQYAGEQFDAVLGDYYLRQRFYDTSSGRFGRMDTYEGRSNQPLTLHKYIYANDNPITNVDPSGYFTATEWQVAILIATVFLVAGGYAATSGRQGVRREEENRLPGFNEGAKPGKLLDSVLRWADSWRIPPLPGFGGTPVPMAPSHTGHAVRDIGNFVTHVFQTSQDCSEIAKEYKEKMPGGKIVRILPLAGHSVVFESPNREVSWWYHDVYVKDGKAYDPLGYGQEAGDNGIPLDEWAQGYKDSNSGNVTIPNL